MENYEEKYKRALERARIGLHDCNLLDCDDMTRKSAITTIYHLFPELIEDEDERIRKGIIRNLQYLMDRSEGFVKEDLQERIAWLEKQKPNTHKREIDDAYLQGICDAKHAIEKQGESTRTNDEIPFDIEIPFGANDSELQEVSYNIPEGFYAEIKDDRVVIKKVEPKFKVVDWVIKNGIVAQILDKQKYGFVGLDIDGKDFFCNYGHTDSMRLWTIGDAKDGDVLSFYLEYKGNKMVQTGIIEKYVGKHGGCSNTFKVYVGVNWENNFQIGEHMGCSDIRPATKEQRDLLFSKIKQAGYEWNAEKKELKKIDVASKEGDDKRIRKAIHIYLDWLDGREDYQPKGVYTIRDMIDWVIKQDKKISADKVIEWLNHHELSRDDVVTSVIPDDSPTSVPHRAKWLSDEFIKQFKKDFGL